MKLITIGINHKTAPLEIREKAVFNAENTAAALQELVSKKAVNEAVILSTCHRTEIYTNTDNVVGLSKWLAEHRFIDENILNPYLYCYEQEAAVRHIMRVACGLDSMVLGEPQILGQLKAAVAIAQENGALGGYLGRLFQSVFAAGKQIRTETRIGASAVSIAYASLTLAKRIFTDVTKATVLLLGAGETTELVATHFHKHGIRQLIIANRTYEKAALLAQQFNAQAITLADINAYLPQADIVVAATASQLPILGKGAVETALKLRKHRPMLMIDLAVPRNMEAELASLEDVYLYHLDDLQAIINENMKNRSTAAAQAEALVEIKAAHFIREVGALQYVDIIRNYRDNIEKIAATELAENLRQLQQGKDSEEIFKSFAYSLIQKILHKPTIHLRNAAYEGDVELLLLAKRLFDI